MTDDAEKYSNTQHVFSPCLILICNCVLL